MAKNLELCGLIYGQYNSVAAFAREIGMSRQRMQSIASGRTDPTLEDVDKISKALHKPSGEILDLFLRFKSTKVGNKQQ